jgi:putative ABC transport system permease protein
MTSFRQDITYGIRTLLDRPAFTIIAAISLALGIGVNTTIFSIINATLLSPLGLEDEDRIVAVMTHPLEFPDSRGAAAYREYLAFQEAESFEAVGALLNGVKNLGSDADGTPPEELQVVRSTPALYRALDIRPQIGRLISEEEDQVDNWAPVALLTGSFWERRFGRDPGVLGETLRLDGVETTIIGVMPDGLEDKLFFPDADLWVPSEFVLAQTISEGRFILSIGRLAEGRTIGQAQAEVDGIARRFAEEYPNTNETTGFGVIGLHDLIYGGAEEPLLILQGAVLFVLLIACANVAGLMLARASSRQTEIAIRSAVGAVRGRLVRQVLTESVVLSAIGGVLGVFLAWAGLRIFVAVAPPQVPNLDSMTINPSVLAFTGLIVVLTALAFGILPAIQGTRPDLTTLLNESARGSSSGVVRQRVRLVMVAMQTGVALVLLIAAGLLINSFIQLRDNELGADPEGILTFRVQFSQDETITFTGEQVAGVGLWDVNPQVGLTVRSIHDQLQLIPGLAGAAAASAPPFMGSAGRALSIDGRATAEDGSDLNVAYLAVTPGYFETLGVDVEQGRGITDRDDSSAAPIVLVNEAMAAQYWETGNPLGSYITLDFVPGEPAREVVGVVSNVLLSQFQEAAVPAMYVPYAQQTSQWRGPQWNQRASVFFLVKGQGEAMDLLPAVQRAVERADPDRPLNDIRTVDQYLDEQAQGNVLWVGLLGTFGVIAGMLAVSGIYGVVSYSVAQRTHEIGIRMALGASSRRIIALIMRQAVFIVGVGLVIGVVGALLLTRVIAGTLFGVEATDPVTFVAVSLILLLAALTACLVPTWRALRVAPSEALRYE